MTLVARLGLVPVDVAEDRELVVACPQRVDPVPIRQCSQCELCEGLELAGGSVGVRCAVEPEVGHDGSPGPGAPVTAIMTGEVVSVEEDASIENVQWLLLARGIGAVPVLDRTGRPVGVLSKSDLLREHEVPEISVRIRARGNELFETSRSTSGFCARDVMTPVVHAVLERASIAAAAAMMARERVHHVLVVSDAGQLRGIVSTLDVARWVAARERFAPRTI